MNQQKANAIFRGSLGQQLDCVFVTSDDVPFIRREEAEVHTRSLEIKTITAWYPDDYRIVREYTGHKSAKYRYVVMAGSDSQRIGQRNTNHEYIACLVCDLAHPERPPIGGYSKLSTGYAVICWFGRKDLIGKGDSRHYFGKPGVAVAYLEGMEP